MFNSTELRIFVKYKSSLPDYLLDNMNRRGHFFAITIISYNKKGSLVNGGGYLSSSFYTGEQLIWSAVHNSCEIVSFYNGKAIARWGSYAPRTNNASK